MRTSLHALLRGMLVMAAFSIAAVAPSRADADAKDPKADKCERGDSDKFAEDTDPVLSVTAHQITVDGRVIKYHATAGYMLLKQEEGKPLVPPTAARAAQAPG